MSSTIFKSMIGLRIFVVSHGFQTAYERGFCNALGRNGADTILAASDKTDIFGLDDCVGCINIRGSQESGRSILKKIANFVFYHIKLLLLAWKNRTRTLHVIGLTDFPVFIGLFEGLLFRIFCQRYVLTVHNLLPHGKHGVWNRFVYRWIYSIPEYLVVHTQTMRHQLTTQFFVNDAKIVIMQHGCELNEFDLPYLVNKDNKNTGLLFFGSILEYKGVDVLIRAYEKLPSNFELVILGYCRSAALASKIREQISKVPSTHKVVWKNEYVTDREMANSMLNADMLIMPYRHIDQSGVIFQALKFGLPIVASRVGEFERMVSKDIGELCTPDDDDSLINAILNLSFRINSVSRVNIQMHALQYQWEHTVESLCEIYV